MKEIKLQITDSRRLTGPNLFWNKPGAILDVAIDDDIKENIIKDWSKNCRTLLDALNWHNQHITHRSYKGGASLVISAPIDCLYAATEVTESAWQMTMDTMDNQAIDLKRVLEQLNSEIFDEKNPALIALQQAAKDNKVKFLSDDDEISLGYGESCQIYPINDLPNVDAINWQSIKDIPVAMVTGTNGKSTTVRLASSVVKAAGLNCGITSTDYIRVGDKIIDDGDYSGPGGARTLLRHPGTQTALLEVARGGMLRRGLGINQATCVVVTNVAEDHLGEYGINTLDEMVEAKFTVRQAITKDQDLILNADDTGSVKFAQSLDNTLVWFSWHDDNPVIVEHISQGGKACFVEKGEIIYFDGKNKINIAAIKDIPITINGAAKHNIHNALAVTAMCHALGFDHKCIAQGLRNFSNSPENNPGRGNLFEFDGVKAIADFAHNEHGLNLMAQTIKNMPAKRRLVMLGQAGDRSDALIEGLVKSALKAHPDALVICEMESHLRGRELGEIPQLIGEYAVKHGMQVNQLIFAKNTIDGTTKALGWSQPEDVLLLLALTNRNEIIEILSKLSG